MFLSITLIGVLTSRDDQTNPGNIIFKIKDIFIAHGSKLSNRGHGSKISDFQDT